MSFLSRFFHSGDSTPIPDFDEVLRERGIPADTPGLEPFREEFRHVQATEREAWLTALQATLAQGWSLPPEWIDAQFDLMPDVVPLWQAERDGFHYRPHVEGLAVRILACGQVIPPPWFTLWGLKPEDVLDRALEQLAEKSKDKPFKRLPSGIYEAEYGDGRASARILLPELWTHLFPGQNTFVAIPSEDVLLASPQVLLPKLVEAIAHALGRPGRRVMATIYQYVDGILLPANLQDPHPIAQPQRELRQSDVAEAYRAQAESLGDSQGIPAPMGVLRTQQGRSVSFSTWQEGAPVLLPDSDLVGFLAADGRPLGIFFRQTLPRISELHGTPVDIWGPRRLRFEGFPTPDQLERLECFATADQMAALMKGSAPHPAHAPRPSTASMANQATGGALSSSGSSPVPAHLRGLSLGIQGDD
jgi:hypothetical protein